MRKIFSAFTLSPDFSQGIMSTASKNWTCIAFCLLGNGRFSLGMPLIDPMGMPRRPAVKQEGTQNPKHTENVTQASRHCHPGCWACPGVVQDTSGGLREEQSHGGGHSFTGLLYNILSLQTLQTILFSQSPSLLDAQDVRENQVSQIISLKKKSTFVRQAAQ